MIIPVLPKLVIQECRDGASKIDYPGALTPLRGGNTVSSFECLAFCVSSHEAHCSPFCCAAHVLCNCGNQKKLLCVHVVIICGAYFWWTFCGHVVLMLCSCCVHFVLILCSFCVNFVLMLCSCCAPVVFSLCSFCVYFVFILCPCCVPVVFLLCSFCVHFVLMLCSCCAHVVLLLC